MQAILYDITDAEKRTVQCKLCAHYCEIKDGHSGVCKIRENSRGELKTLSWGQAGGTAMDPIEKKPFFHYKPGSNVLSFGTPGCNFKCLNCQNSSLSQTVKYHRDAVLKKDLLRPEDIVEQAILYRADGIAYTYSEPTIFFEYVRDTVLRARERDESANMFHLFISNGFFSLEMFELVIKEKLLDAVNIDLKFTDDKKYRKITGGSLQPVLDNIKRVNEHREQLHLEIINLVIPGENDSDEDFDRISEFIASVSPDIPIHFNRFHPCFEMPDKPATEIETLFRAKEIAQRAGLQHIYIGNTPLKEVEDSYCPHCNALLIARNRFGILSNKLGESHKQKPAKCPQCGNEINFVV